MENGLRPYNSYNWITVALQMEPALERNLQKSNELKKKSHTHNGILWIPKLSSNLEATLYIPGDFKAATTRHHTCHCGRFRGILSKNN